MGATILPANGQTTKTKKNLLYVVLVKKNFPSYYKYIHLRAIFVLEKGGVLLLGHIRYVVSTAQTILHIYKDNKILAAGLCWAFVSQ